MATYMFLGGDSFDDPNNWYNVTTGMPDDGVPGTDDTIGGSTALIPAAGETVANAKGTTSKPVEIKGDLTITGEGSDLWLLFGGNFSIGTIEGGYIVMSNDTTVTAGSVDLNQPNNTGLSLDGTSSLTVTGSVVAQGDNIDTSGTFNVDGGVSVTNATLEIDGGVATIGSLSVVDSTVQVGSSSGASSDATLKVTGDATVGATGAVNLTGDGSTLSVGGNLVIDSGSLTVDEDSTLAVTGDILIGDNSAAGSPADVTASPAATSFAGSVTLDVDNATLRDDCVIGDNAKGTLTLDSNSTLNANNHNVTVGNQEPGNGQLVVDGDGAKLTGIKSLIVGEYGTGTMLIKNHGYVDASTLKDGSRSSQGAGTITVSGGKLGAVNAYVGEDADGSLTVKNDGAVKIGSSLVVGFEGHLHVLGTVRE
jgi:T5SS/PEP-CTERM-associated repeat protein